MGRKLSFDGIAGSDADWTVKSAAYTAVTGDALLLDASGGAFTITLPAAAVEDDYIDFADATGHLKDNNVTLARNGLKIMGLAEDLVVDTKNIGFRLTYYNTAQGWRVT
ncbi:hypothetical protein CMK18_22165 [Candidatus Poribacteria bacterium]|nr:hypothetical protein [Candidatus Poribacteria bacterium]